VTRQSSKCTRYVFETLLVNWRKSGHVCHCPIALFVMRFVQTLRSVALTSSKVEAEACIYGSPYLPISVQTPALASFCPRISMDAPIESQMEGLQQRDRQQSPPDSPPLSDSPRVAREEINQRRREVRIDFLRTSRSSHKFHLEPISRYCGIWEVPWPLYEADWDILMSCRARKFDAFDPWLCALNVAIRLGYQLTCFLQYSVEELRIELLKEHFGCGKRKQ
jgi:hypothetical protein